MTTTDGRKIWKTKDAALKYIRSFDQEREEEGLPPLRLVILRTSWGKVTGYTWGDPGPTICGACGRALNANHNPDCFMPWEEGTK